MINFFLYLATFANVLCAIVMIREIRKMKYNTVIPDDTPKSYQGSVLKIQRSKPKIVKETVFEDENKL